MRRDAIIECSRIAVPFAGPLGSRISTAKDHPDAVFNVMFSKGAAGGTGVRLRKRPMAIGSSSVEGQSDGLVAVGEPEVLGRLDVDGDAPVAEIAHLGDHDPHEGG